MTLPQTTQELVDYLGEGWVVSGGYAQQFGMLLAVCTDFGGPETLSYVAYGTRPGGFTQSEACSRPEIALAEILELYAGDPEAERAVLEEELAERAEQVARLREYL